MSLKKFPSFLLNFSESEMAGEAKHSYRFRSFRLDVAERRLLNNNAAIALTPKAFDVLAMLVEHGGHLVEKDELLKQVWADSFVEEANIARIIHTLRKALGEDENGNKFIETVATKGYRFVANVTTDRSLQISSDDEFPDTIHLDEPDAGTSRVSARDTTVKGPSPTRFVFFTVGFVTAVSLLLLLSFNFWQGSTAGPARGKSIAVLPVVPVAVENREPIFELGIPESLILKLSSSKGLVVRHLSATRRFTDIDQDPLAAGRELGVDYVLASNYQLAGGKIRITSQLFDLATGRIEETYKSEKDAGTLFATQDVIADEIGNMLLARLSVSSDVPEHRRGTTNEEAYRLYLHGKSLAVQRNDKDSAKAVESLEQAVALDPNFAQAHARLALAYHFTGGFRGSGPMAEKARVSVAKAFELDGNVAEAYAVRGIMGFAVDWNFDASETDLQRAIELEPNHDLAHWGYAMLSCFRGRFDQAMTAIETAQTISPGTVIYSRDRGRILYYARRYDESIAQFRRALELDDDIGSVWGHLWLAYEMKGDHAIAFETRLNRRIANEQADIEDFKRAYETGGLSAVWRLELENNKQTETQPGANFYAMARLCIYLGDKEQAFHYLNKTYENRQFQMGMLLVDPVLDPIRGDPRFDELVRRVGLK